MVILSLCSISLPFFSLSLSLSLSRSGNYPRQPAHHEIVILEETEKSSFPPKKRTGGQPVPETDSFRTRGADLALVQDYSTRQHIRHCDVSKKMQRPESGHFRQIKNCASREFIQIPRKFDRIDHGDEI